MKKSSSIKIGLIISFIAIELTACGGSTSKKESKTEQISKREYIAIIYHYPKDVCTSSVLREELQRMGAKDIITSVGNRDVACEPYEKNNDNNECGTMDAGYYNEPTCVVEVNEVRSGLYKYDMQTLENIKETVIKAY